VNFGNADENGAKVNDWNPKNTDEYAGFFLSRSVMRKRAYSPFAFLSQPPINFPISKTRPSMPP
jgi:hypothetical protein